METGNHTLGARGYELNTNMLFCWVQNIRMTKMEMSIQKKFPSFYKRRIPSQKPNMNAHIESFNKVFEDDCLSKCHFETYKEAS